MGVQGPVEVVEHVEEAVKAAEESEGVVEFIDL